MKWTNGFYSITSNGDLTSFFEAIRDTLPTYTGFEVIEFMPEGAYTMTFDTIGGIYLTLSSEASTTKSSSYISVKYVRNSVILKNTSIDSSNTNPISTQQVTRTINFHTFENAKGYKNFSLATYNSTSCSINGNYDIGTTKVVSITDNSKIDMYFCGNVFYSEDDLQLYSCTTYVLNVHTCEGIIMIPYVLSNVNTQTPKVTYYVDGLYLSSNNSVYKRYKCNNKQYLALATNTMMEE